MQTSSYMKDINTCHFSNLFIEVKSSIDQFISFYVSHNLQLTLIRDIDYQIAIKHSSYQKRKLYCPKLVLVSIEKTDLILYLDLSYLQICSNFEN